MKDEKINEDGSKTPCLIGEGVFPVLDVIKLLNNKGFDGYYSLEWEKFWNDALEEPEVALPAYVRYMRKIEIEI